MSGRGNKLNNVMVIEGDVAGDESYFEGICDCKSPILSNIGKNLFDGEMESGTIGYTGNLSEDTTRARSQNYITIDSSQTYRFINYEDYVFRACYEYDSNKKIIRQMSSVGQSLALSFTSNTKYIKFVIAKPDTSSTIDSFTQKIAIYLGNDTTTTYEPYKSNILTCETYFDEVSQSDKTIVLRSLPNGVCDTLNVETGEYVQRIGEAILNGSQGVSSWWNTTSTIGVGIPIPTMKNISKLNCDKLPVVSYGAINNDTYDKDGIASWDTGNIIRFRIEKSKLTTEDVDGVKQYLQQNPITIQYELINPIVTTVDLSGYPFSYENGHVVLSSGSIEQSLTPKVEYSLSANKTGQINSNTKRVSAHQKQLDDFEAMMLTQMVQSAYDKAILQFDYEMQMMSLGGE